MLVPLRFQLALQTASLRAAAFQGLRDAADLRQVPAERASELMLLPSRRLAAAIRLQAIYRGAVARWRLACHQSTCSDEEWEACDDVNLAASENTQMPSQVPSVNLQAVRVPSFSVIGKEAIRVALARLDGGTGHEFVLEQAVHYHCICGKKHCCKGLAALEAAEAKLDALCGVAGRSLRRMRPQMYGRGGGVARIQGRLVTGAMLLSAVLPKRLRNRTDPFLVARAPVPSAEYSGNYWLLPPPAGQQPTFEFDLPITWSFAMRMRYGKILAVAIVAAVSGEARPSRPLQEHGEQGGIEDFLAEDVARLQVSLLQSSLTVARTERTPEQEALFATPVSGLQPSWLWEVEGLSNYGRAAKATMSRHLSLVLQLTLPTDRTAVSGLPALVVFMVAALVMVLFVSQMIGVFFEERSKEELRYFPGSEGPKPRWPGDFAGGDGQERSTIGGWSLPPMTLPNTPVANMEGGSSAVSTLPLLDRWSEPVRSGSLTGTLPEASDRAALIPRLIQPSAEAQFHVPAEGLSSLWRGESPVGIFGPGGHTLLFARFSQDSKERQWLELSTTANTQFPHCRVGPLRQDAAGVDVRGPAGERYALLQRFGSQWQLRRAEGQVLLSIGANVGGPGLTAATEGQLTATAWPEHSGGGLVVKVSPGRDPLLALLCLLAVLLLSPELSGLGR
ncbi:hypothetical protein AK812_SmicGene24848 [Symbiodinium microadriaticum]|uniref:Uncharacterized protein n=1 Tax=Symbiodinium microadriaticum TaxID=2951 RepID=A0A1Q9DDF8_SYMMI|nr:hypothetical protein AK812_SmicGene24848 [Symbiodinium microadriaticum]CAE7484920.1 unnamed protein product [Symbiodinium microadriaticum]CAE7945148.1 unnamed protein product [Symbiodinium sp. KB8]